MLGISIKIYNEFRVGRFEDIRVLWQQMEMDYSVIFLMLFCSTLNWVLEAKKWQFLVNPIEQLAFFKSLKSVFVGLSIGFFTPRSIGDYFGRVMILSSKDRLSLVGGLFVSRVSQMLATVVFGFWGMTYLLLNGLKQSYLLSYVFALASTFIISIIVIQLFKTRLINWLLGFSRARIWVLILNLLKEYRNELLQKVVLVSLLRYITFLFQFFLAASFFNFELVVVPYLAVVCSVLLLKSVIPSFNFLSDLGVRELGAFLLFPFVGVGPLTGVSIGLMVWFFNVLLPSAIGGFLTWGVKWKWQ